MNQAPLVDLILPFYRPHPGWADTVASAVAGLRSALERSGCRLHVFIVNDGSPLSGFTAADLDKVRAAASGAFTFTGYGTNRGKGYAVRYAVAAAGGDYQVYTDGDFPFGWECVAETVDKLRGGDDVVMGVRGAEYARSLSFIRRLVSAGVHVLNRFFLRLPAGLCDTQAGMKGFNAAGRRIFLSGAADSFVFDMEFIAMAHAAGLSVCALPLRLRSGIRMSKMGKGIILRELCGFFRIRRRVLAARGKNELS